jgi:hypothetical protein
MREDCKNAAISIADISQNPTSPTNWKPSHSKLVLVSELGGSRIAAHVDPQRPDAWRREPYYSQLKRWAAAVVPHRGQVVACIGQRTFMIFPDRDVDLGIVGDDDRIITGERETPLGIHLEAYKLHNDDPRVQGLPPQQCETALGTTQPE